MGILNKALLIFSILVLVGCTNIQTSTEVIGVQQPTQLPLPLSRKITDLKLSVARFEWWITDENNWQKISHGTAFCIEKNDAGSLWITCKHVAEAPFKDPNIKYQPFLNYYDSNSSVLYEVTKIYLSEKYDAACFVVEDFKPLAKLNLSKDTTILRNDKKQKDILLGAGYPLSIYPALVTMGIYNKHASDGGLVTSVGGWYGNSGGPIVSLETMEVVGMYTRFNNWPPPMSNDHWHTSSEMIREFLGTLKK